MILKFGGTCSRCGRAIPKGAQANYDAETKTVDHFNCPESEAGSGVPSSFLPHAEAVQFLWSRLCLLPIESTENGSEVRHVGTKLKIGECR